MLEEELATQIIAQYSLPEYLNRDKTVSSYDLVLGLLYLDTIQQVSESLGFSDSNLKHLISSKLRSYFPNKPSNRWSTYFFSLFNLKRCSKCKEIKETNLFSSIISEPDGLNRLCKPCDNKKKIGV